MSQVEPRHILFIVGMHRSGTSALCAALQSCGASFSADLLDPVAGVNDEGFWESAEIVAANEDILASAGCQWFTVSSAQIGIDWAETKFAKHYETVQALLTEPRGEGPLEVIKDPRLCITMPLWIMACLDSNIDFSVCVISRDPMEVSHSLLSRDAFPLGYSLRLQDAYLRGIQENIPQGACYVTYESLLANPVAVLEQLTHQSPLKVVDREALLSSVRRDLQHQTGAEQAEGSDTDLNTPSALRKQIQEALLRHDFSEPKTSEDFARTLVWRGQELTRVGELHSHALNVLSERDEKIIEDRDRFQDMELRRQEMDVRLQEIGDLHSAALLRLREIDARIERINRWPILRRIFREMWKHAAG